MKISKPSSLLLTSSSGNSHELIAPEYLFNSGDHYQQSEGIRGNNRDKDNLLDFSLIKRGAILKKGSRGPLVKSLQERLTVLGFGVQKTAIFGSTTEAVLKDFQRSFNVQPTGQLGPTTLKALEKAEQGVKRKQLSRQARLIAQTRQTTGWCYRAVYHAITPIFGDFLRGSSAFMAANQLAKHPRFKEIKVSYSQLPQLKAGAVVVWNQSPRSPHGHISISLGNGYEASDHIDKQRTHLRGYRRFRVFIPI